MQLFTALPSFNVSGRLVVVAPPVTCRAASSPSHLRQEYIRNLVSG